MDIAQKLIEDGKISEARDRLNKLEADDPHHPRILHLLGKVNQDNLYEVERYYRKALKIDPNYYPAILALHDHLVRLRRFDEVGELRKRIIQLQPTARHFIEMIDATQALLYGDYATGFALYESRLMVPPIKTSVFPRWAGEDLTDKSIVIRSEGGFGDEIQFVRFARQIKDRGAKEVAFWGNPALRRMLRMVDGIDTVPDIAATTTTQRYDYDILTFSIPYLMGTTLTNIPSKPYLSVDDADRRWRHILQAETLPKVGIAWAGSAETEDNTLRSMKLEQLRPLFDVDCHFFSLQKREPQNELKHFTCFRPIHDIMDSMHDFYDTACLIAELDLVISVDSAVAHLAAAMGKPVWMLSRYNGCWRWLLDRSDSPWYPSLTIFRQDVPRNWDSTIDKVAKRLHEWRLTFNQKPATTRIKKKLSHVLR